MRSTLTVRLSEKEAQRLDALCEITGKSRFERMRLCPLGSAW